MNGWPLSTGDSLMRISLVGQTQVLKPGRPSSESQHIHEVLEQIHYAEQQGFFKRMVFGASLPARCGLITAYDWTYYQISRRK
jgi:hypothetical protein